MLLTVEISTDATGNDGERKDKLRSKPLSGTLYVTLKGARELDHASIVSGRSRSANNVMETYVSIKVEGTQLAKLTLRKRTAGTKISKSLLIRQTRSKSLSTTSRSTNRMLFPSVFSGFESPTWSILCGVRKLVWMVKVDGLRPGLCREITTVECQRNHRLVAI